MRRHLQDWQDAILGTANPPKIAPLPDASGRGWGQGSPDHLRHASQLQRRMQQGVANRFQVVSFGALGFMVTDAVFAWGEEHGRRHAIGDITGIVSGAGCDVCMRYAEPLARALHRGHAAFVKCRGRIVGDLFQRQFQTDIVGDFTADLSQRRVHIR